MSIPHPTGLCILTREEASIPDPWWEEPARAAMRTDLIDTGLLRRGDLPYAHQRPTSVLASVCHQLAHGRSRVYHRPPPNTLSLRPTGTHRPGAAGGAPLTTRFLTDSA